MNKNVTAIVGCKWGDEGKGKIASMQSEDATLVIRGTGGANAGHSVVYNGRTLPLHLVPGGITYPQTTAIIGPGVVIDPEVLLAEIEMLKGHGVPDIESRLKISGRAHVVFPYHKDLDSLHEFLKENPVGTTKRGIGPCYADKANRVGIRMYDLLLPEEELRSKIVEATKLHIQAFENNNMSVRISPKELAREYSNYGKQLAQYITNIEPIISNAIDNNNKIVIEGAQAFRLDLDHGDYNMVTSSNCSTAGSLCGSAIPPSALKEVIGIDKAYNSRVGNGPFPTEQPSSLITEGNGMLVGDVIRELGHEYGTTTKRPRRCGWMDCVILRSAKYTMGVDYLCINHLDTLGKIGLKLGYIKVCTEYLYNGSIVRYFPDDINLTKEIPEPIYETLYGGWEIDSSCKCYDDLPELAKQFIQIVENTSGIPVKYLGTGPANDDLIIREDV